jgi:hypothetical protein
MQDRDTYILGEVYKLISEEGLQARTGHKGFTGRVFVYFNINLSDKLKSAYFSIKDMSVPKGKVIGHDTSFIVRDATFKVSQAGNERVRREGKKNVHAGVVGYFVEEEPRILPVSITYDPYKYKTFVRRDDGSPIYNAKLVSFVNGKLTAQV